LFLCLSICVNCDFQYSTSNILLLYILDNIISKGLPCVCYSCWTAAYCLGFLMLISFPKSTILCWDVDLNFSHSLDKSDRVSAGIWHRELWPVSSQLLYHHYRPRNDSCPQHSTTLSCAKRWQWTSFLTDRRLHYQAEWTPCCTDSADMQFVSRVLVFAPLPDSLETICVYTGQFSWVCVHFCTHWTLHCVAQLHRHRHFLTP